ncbi:MAG: peptidylprolyl isomerase [Bacteroidetes bacterium]|nr:peptidylprolyl isomerase [Bacteroidota bacterium]MCL1968184.1 peptidylprolyl isomerase [Bacteroidota bacterium]MCL1968551.1 peptidylprolyl isomerase [Bacteroidota bacterium]
MKNITLLVILSLMLSVCCTAQTKKETTKTTKETTKTNDGTNATVEPKKVQEVMQEVIIETSLGNITIALYNETPLHRDNFIKLANDHFYDGVLFHRIIQNFMIQAGDPDSKGAAKGQRLGMGGPGYTIPAEILPQFSHKKGTLAAARQGDQVNPKRESSGSQFYIVDNPNGAHHLDGAYTIFGEVIKGLDVVDKIASQPKDQADRPLTDIKIISMKVVKQQ